MEFLTKEDDRIAKYISFSSIKTNEICEMFYSYKGIQYSVFYHCSKENIIQIIGVGEITHEINPLQLEEIYSYHLLTKIKMQQCIKEKLSNVWGIKYEFNKPILRACFYHFQCQNVKYLQAVIVVF